MGNALYEVEAQLQKCEQDAAYNELILREELAKVTEIARRLQKQTLPNNMESLKAEKRRREVAEAILACRDEELDKERERIKVLQRAFEAENKLRKELDARLGQPPEKTDADRSATRTKQIPRLGRHDKYYLPVQKTNKK